VGHQPARQDLSYRRALRANNQTRSVSSLFVGNNSDIVVSLVMKPVLRPRRMGLGSKTA
jgi:hypothetical protein